METVLLTYWTFNAKRYSTIGFWYLAIILELSLAFMDVEEQQQSFQEIIISWLTSTDRDLWTFVMICQGIKLSCYVTFTNIRTQWKSFYKTASVKSLTAIRKIWISIFSIGFFTTLNISSSRRTLLSWEQVRTLTSSTLLHKGTWKFTLNTKETNSCLRYWKEGLSLITIWFLLTISWE